MSPLSVLPGRIRLEDRSLIGKEYGCALLQRSVSEIDGVLDVSVNYRTGRILIRFDENRIDKRSLPHHIGVLKESLSGELDKAGPLSEGTKSAPVPGGVAHVVIDMVAHALLPKPLNFLLPAAISTLMK
ncbi:MAG: heavy-metal-associated domain-containing protein [Alphaproteobacteria bacterium]|uniref:Heavy-metal-associated domain-containing protein n=1 Tax=Candidatus Nitrobium versatile TaxID=2884831 RepID=A0A953M2N5_9BACT|nr:heavy-metal-associated domain-containing protein [Candidatus Nitrobium versatile]